MQFVTTFIVMLCSIHVRGSIPSIHLGEGEIKRDYDEIAFLRQYTARPSNFTSTNRIPTTTAASERGSLDDVSIQDLLQLNSNANVKIQKKIIDEIKTIPIIFKNYREPLIFNSANYEFEKNKSTYIADEGHTVTFYDISLSHSYDYRFDEERKYKFSYSLSCDGPTKAKIRVALPTNVQITAKFSTTHVPKKSEYQGRVTIVIRNGAFLRHDDNSNNNTELLFDNSKFDVQFDTTTESQSQLQSAVYHNLHKFFDEMQSSLRSFFGSQLDNLMLTRDLNPSLDCSEIRYPDPESKKSNLPYYDNYYNYLNNFYVIPNVKLETWKGVTLSVGPIVMTGFSFNNIEFSVSRETRSDYDSYYRKELSTKIRTGKLDGKFEWKYDSNEEKLNKSSFAVSFSVDNIIFDNKYEIDSYYGDLKQNMNVYLGDIKIKPSSVNPPNSDIYEVNFVKFVLSRYLNRTIGESLTQSFSQMIDDSQKSFVQTYFN